MRIIYLIRLAKTVASRAENYTTGKIKLKLIEASNENHIRIFEK